MQVFFADCGKKDRSARMGGMKRTTMTWRRRTTGSLGIPGLKLPRGVPTLVRSVGRHFKGRTKKRAGASSGASGGAWIWVVLGLALAAWISWDMLGGGRYPTRWVVWIAKQENSSFLVHTLCFEILPVNFKAGGGVGETQHTLCHLATIIFHRRKEAVIIG